MLTEANVLAEPFRQVVVFCLKDSFRSVATIRPVPLNVSIAAVADISLYVRILHQTTFGVQSRKHELMFQLWVECLPSSGTAFPCPHLE